MGTRESHTGRRNRRRRSGTPLLLSGLLGCTLVACDRPKTADVAPDRNANSTQHDAPGSAASSGTGGADAAPAVPPVARPAVEPPPPLPTPPSSSTAGECPKRRDPNVGVIVNPRQAHEGAPVQVMFATLEGEEALAVKVVDKNGEEVKVRAVHRWGVPASTLVTWKGSSEASPYVVTAGRSGTGMRCVKVSVMSGGAKLEPPPPQLDQVWSLRRSWGPAEEALFSAWVRELFWAPAGEDLAFDQLTRVTSDPKRNVLFDHLGWGEDDDQEGLTLIPDCADTPYFLRAYFAWKRGLPFGFRRCSRGEGGPPHCYDLQTNQAKPELAPEWSNAPAAPQGQGTEPTGTAPASPPSAKPAVETTPFDALMVIDRFFRRTVAWGVHSGNGRTPYADDRTDFYPLELSRKSLRPGTTYADPYGHLFVLVELVGQRGKRPGILYAVDGQPDGSITRKRFWEGNFLWNPDPQLGGSGFKAFRPIDLVDVETPEPGEPERVMVAATNEAIAARKGYGNVDVELGKLSKEAFYDQMDRLISPGPLDPFLAQDAAIEALAEAARVRVTSVDNGVKYVSEHPEAPVEMPWGHDVFETTGAWENYSTPARDLRLLIAMDVVAGFDQKVARQPEAYGIESETDLTAVREALRVERERMLADPKYAFSYTRTDGSEQRLTLADLFERMERLEMAYNPNDCVEVRWGAKAGSAEMKTCRSHAPEPQRKKMRAYRSWFQKRQRPARGDPGPTIPGLPNPSVAPAAP